MSRYDCDSSVKSQKQVSSLLLIHRNVRRRPEKTTRGLERRCMERVGTSGLKIFLVTSLCEWCCFRPTWGEAQGPLTCVQTWKLESPYIWTARLSNLRFFFLI